MTTQSRITRHLRFHMLHIIPAIYPVIQRLVKGFIEKNIPHVVLFFHNTPNKNKFVLIIPFLWITKMYIFIFADPSLINILIPITLK